MNTKRIRRADIGCPEGAHFRHVAKERKFHAFAQMLAVPEQRRERNHPRRRSLPLRRSPVLKPLSAWVLVTFVAANLVMPAAAQIPVSIQATQNPKERCANAIAFFDRYGASRTENSDGQRNHTRIGAEIDCQRGRYEEGITAIEDLLRRKKFDIPF